MVCDFDGCHADCASLPDAPAKSEGRGNSKEAPKRPNSWARTPARDATKISSTHSRRVLITRWKATRSAASKAKPAKPATGREASTRNRCHAADIRNPAKLAAAEADKVCLSCHLNQPTHVGRIRAATPRTRCAASPATPSTRTAPTAWWRANRPTSTACAPCHQDVWASFQRPYRHTSCRRAPCRCVDCHNPHGTFEPRMLQTVSANEPGCLKCHGDRPGRLYMSTPRCELEGCMACHQPHGSSNPRMLTRQVVRLVCQECHSNFQALPAKGGTLGSIAPAFHDTNSPRFQNCTNCHQKVHGSYVNRDLLK